MFRLKVVVRLCSIGFMLLVPHAALSASSLFQTAQSYSSGGLGTFSVAVADVNGDGKPDLCGRGTTGIICAPGKGDGTFGTLQQWDTNFSDAQGWHLAQYGTTMLLADLNGDGKMDVCGRGTAGI